MKILMNRPLQDFDTAATHFRILNLVQKREMGNVSTRIAHSVVLIYRFDRPDETRPCHFKYRVPIFQAVRVWVG